MVAFYKSVHSTVAAIAALNPSDLKIGDTASIQGVAKTLAAGTMSYYTGNATTFADLPAPYYWWECGAMVGAMLDYSHYTNDTSYDDAMITALQAQVGPHFDYMLPRHFGDMGNDDLDFWGFSVLAAAERNLPQPDAAIPSWLRLAENVWNGLASRWNTTNCGGGLLWQIFPSNPNGMDYRNSVSNGGFFQISARLYRATENRTYLDWAERVYDWSAAVGLVDASYNVYDGAGARDNCAKVNRLAFTYSQAIYLHGAAVVANATGGNATWAGRAAGFVRAARDSFFSPYPNATGVMYERACEPYGSCDTDMLSFKGYMARFMWKAAQMVPALAPDVRALLRPSAEAAARACSGGGGAACGTKWYVGGFDGATGLGQEMSALEAVQGLLAEQAPPPLRKGEIQDVRTPAAAATPAPAAATSTSATPTPTSVPTKRSGAPGGRRAGRWAVAAGVLAAVLAVGLM